MLSFFTFLMFLGCAYAYFLYPAILFFLPKKTSKENAASIDKVSVIIAARNEERYIATRIENILAAEGNPEIIVCSDASDDRTDEIVASYADRGVKLVRSPERKGKEFAQALAVKQATGEVLIFTDAKVRTEPSLVTNFLKYFRDETVGAVSSLDKVEVPDEQSSGEGMYVRYEMYLRNLESDFNSLVGLSGSCFAVRKEVASEIRTDIPSDFALLLAAQRLGYRGVIASDVLCYYGAVKTEEEEFKRKVRTVLRGISAFFATPEALQVSPVFTWQIVSHKLFRWLVPIFLILGTVGAYSLSDQSGFWYLVSLALTAFYSLALAGYFFPQTREKKYVKLPLFFIVTNAGIGMAWIKFLMGERSVVWNPSVR